MVEKAQSSELVILPIRFLVYWALEKWTPIFGQVDKSNLCCSLRSLRFIWPLEIHRVGVAPIQRLVSTFSVIKLEVVPQLGVSFLR